MPSGIAKFAAKAALYVGVAAFCIGAYAAINPDAFVRVPGDHNPALTGDWYSGGRVFYRHYRFNPDGTGQIWYGRREPRDFTWGTEDGKLRMKYRAYNGWTAPQFEFKVGSEGLSLQGLTPSADSADLIRDPPKSSRLE